MQMDKYAITLNQHTTLKEDIIQLYRLNDCLNTLNHVLEVADVAIKLAKHFSIEKESCYYGALLHDISAILSPDIMMKIAMQENIKIYEAEKRYPFLLHQRISRMIAKDYFNICDETILSAIEHHTTLCKEPTKTDMVVFIADKIAWDQEGVPPHLSTIQDGLKNSLENACFNYIQYIFNEGKLLYPHDWLIEAGDFFNAMKKKEILVF